MYARERRQITRRRRHATALAGGGAAMVALAAAAGTGMTAGDEFFFDGFESYECGELIVGQSTWEAWENNSSAGDEARVACGTGGDPPAFEGSQYVALASANPGDAEDIVQRLSGVTGGVWRVSAHYYVPATYPSDPHFILMNRYDPNDPASHNWSVQLMMNPSGGYVESQPENTWRPIVTDAWVPIEVVIDFAANWQSIYYDGWLLSEKPWHVNGLAELQAIDLYSGTGPSGWWYCDAVTVESEAVPCDGDENGSGAVDFGDILAVLGNWGACPTARLTADDGDSGDQYGVSVAIDGDRAFVGARYADGHRVANAGAVYAYRWNGAAWVQEQKITASDGDDGAQFGLALAISSDALLVGARADGSGPVGPGAAYVFRWNGSEWIQEQKLTASDGDPGDHFGFAVAMIPGVALIGAYGDDDLGSSAGAAYVFRYNGFTWQEDADKLYALGGQAGDGFGHSVALDNSRAIVGAPFADIAGQDSGSAHAFEWDDDFSEWVENQRLLPPDLAAGDRFSHPLVLRRNVMIFGSSGDDNEQGIDAGAAHVYRWNGFGWVYEQKLTAGAEGAAGDAFGSAVALGIDKAVIGAYLDDDEAMGADAGAAHAFRWNGTEWNRERKMTAYDGTAGDEFGSSAVISGDATLVGARKADAAYLMSARCPGDANGDGVVSFSDILVILGAWGPCP